MSTFAVRWRRDVARGCRLFAASAAIALALGCGGTADDAGTAAGSQSAAAGTLADIDPCALGDTG